MTAAAHDDLLPRAPGGLAPGALLSLLVHGGLIAALTVAVDWRMKAPEAVSAELWSSLPQIAAPRAEAPAPPPALAPTPAPAPPAPPPVAKEAPPPAPDIAIERAAEKRKKEQQAKKDEAAKEKAAAEAERAERAERSKRDAAQAKADDARLAKAREEQMKRMLGSLQGSGNSGNAAGTAAKDAGPSQAYVDRLRAMLRSSVIFPDNGGPNPTVEVRVTATASGTIISHRITKKSGNDEFDDAVQRGLDRLGTLPRDSDGRVPQDILIVHRLRDQ